MLPSFLVKLILGSIGIGVASYFEKQMIDFDVCQLGNGCMWGGVGMIREENRLFSIFFSSR